MHFFLCTFANSNLAFYVASEVMAYFSVWPPNGKKIDLMSDEEKRLFVFYMCMLHMVSTVNYILSQLTL